VSVFMGVYRSVTFFEHHTFMTFRLRPAKLLAISLAGTMTLTPAQLTQAQGNPSPAGMALPALGDGSGMSLSAERRLGDRIARELYRDPDYIDDPVLVDYVNSLWQPLLAAARQRGDLPQELDDTFAWQILLGRDRTVNAFALPGGYFGLHLGLVGVVSNADELASVLAHELSHVSQRHIARLMDRQSAMAPWMLGAMLLGALAASKSGDAGGALMVGGQAAVMQNQLNFSRDMEREADRNGFGVMTQAGFAPQGFVGMFDKLQQSSRLNDSGAYPYLRSHPLTTERVADMQSRMPLGQAAAPVATTLVHVMMAARARALGQVGSEQLQAMVSQARQAGVASQLLSERVAVVYGAAMAASQLRDLAQAEALLVQLELLTAGDEGALQQTRLAQAEQALTRGDARRALQMLALAQDQAGKSAGQVASGDVAWKRTHTLLMARAQVLARQNTEAAQALQLWVGGHPRDAQAWQLLATAQAAQGQTLRAIRAEAEAQVALLDFGAAADRLRAAQDWIRKAPDARAIDQIEAAVIDTRWREVQQVLRLQAAEK
jgi:predicted Zn-dependent protease